MSGRRRVWFRPFAGMAVGQNPDHLRDWMDKGAQWMAIGDDYSLMLRTANQVVDVVQQYVPAAQH